jgi:hypothetical protein
MRIKKIFNSLQGVWRFHRKLKHKATNVSYGEVIGTAIFEKTEDIILFYKENGVFTSQEGKQLKIYREYCYEYSERNDKIIKYFSKDKQKLGCMYNLTFSVKTAKSINAKGKHICINDDYQASFVFPAR